MMDAEAIGSIQVRAWNAAYRDVVPDPFLDEFTVPIRVERWRGILGSDNPRGNACCAREQRRCRVLLTVRSVT
jgi:hypothetical protein